MRRSNEYRRRVKPPKKPAAYTGPIPCLRCDKTFQSWDRRQNRVCPACCKVIAAEPSDEPSYPLLMRRTPDVDKG
jgi:hypothetical protein